MSWKILNYLKNIYTHSPSLVLKLQLTDSLYNFYKKRKKNILSLPTILSSNEKLSSLHIWSVKTTASVSTLLYPITLEGPWGSTEKFATTPFHLVLCSAAIVELGKIIPVQSSILSSHLFFCLPLFLFPFTVPCRIVFAKPEDLET